MLSRFSHAQLCATLWTVALQAPLSMGILQARILEQIAMPSSRDPPDPAMESASLMSPAPAGWFFSTAGDNSALKSHFKCRWHSLTLSPTPCHLA